MRIQHTLALFSLTLLLWPVSVAAAEEETSKATFTLSVAIAPVDQPEAESSSPGQSMEVMSLEGEAYYQAGMLRVDVQDNASQENTTALVDYSAGKLYMLYPDTLNGTSHDLAGFDKFKGFYALRDVMQGSEPTMPDEWQDVCNRALLDGKRCARHTAVSGDNKVEWWVGDGNVPLKAVVTSAPLTITVDVKSFERGVSLDATLFELPTGYTITDAEGVPEGLPSL